MLYSYDQGAPLGNIRWSAFVGLLPNKGESVHLLARFTANHKCYFMYCVMSIWYDTNRKAKSKQSSTYCLSFCAMMPFWQRSGNSNRSHLRSEPTEHAAHTLSHMKIHSSNSLEPGHQTLTVSEHYTVFLTGPALLSGSCEVRLEALLWWSLPAASSFREK